MNEKINHPQLQADEKIGDSSNAESSTEETTKKILSVIANLDELVLTPDQLPLLNDLGFFLLKKGKLEEAERIFKKAVELAPENITALENLGMCFLQQNKNTEVKECFEKIIKIDPENTAALHTLGIALIELEEFEECEKCFRKVLELEPQNIDVSLFLGICLEKQKKGKGLDLIKNALKEKIAIKDSEK